MTYVRTCRACLIHHRHFGITLLNRVILGYSVFCLDWNVRDQDLIARFHSKRFICIFFESHRYCRCTIDRNVVCAGNIKLNMHCECRIRIVLLLIRSGKHDFLDLNTHVLLNKFILIVYLHFRRCCRNRTCTILDADLAVAKTSRIGFRYGVLHILRNVRDHDGISRLHSEGLVRIRSECCSYCCTTIGRYIVSTGCIKLNIYSVLGIRIIVLFRITGYEDLLDRKFTVLLYILVLVVDDGC